MMEILGHPLVLTLIGLMATSSSTAAGYVVRLANRQAALKAESEKQFALLTLAQATVGHKVDRVETKLDDLTDYLLRANGAPRIGGIPHDQG